MTKIDYQLDWIKKQWRVNLYGYFLRGLTEEGRHTLNVDITIQWRGVHRIDNSTKYCQLDTT